jgi:cytochrome d ubiquinol oxidase subunit I
MPLYVFGIPDMQAEQTKYAIGIPYLGSLILTHELKGEVKGLKEFAPEDRPNSTVLFWSFRLMVGLGMLMLLLALSGLLLRKGGKLYEAPWLHKFAILMGPTGYIALLAGWFTTEMGRQPWVVYGVLRTKDALSPVPASQVGFTLIVFVVVYTVVFGTGVYYILKLMHKGPQFIHAQPDEVAGVGHFKTPMRPLSAVDESIDQQTQEHKHD